MFRMQNSVNHRIWFFLFILWAHQIPIFTSWNETLCTSLLNGVFNNLRPCNAEWKVISEQSTGKDVGGVCSDRSSSIGCSGLVYGTILAFAWKD